MTEMLPYPGLRPFTSEETAIFFGREEHVDQLLERLNKTRFLSVIGPSGCGKSSLIRAGLIPALHSGFMSSAGISWSILTMRPGEDPRKSLSMALMQSIMADENKNENTEAFIYSMISRGPLGLVEMLAEKRFQKKRNLLLLVDQFEELFRICTKTNWDDAFAFVNLLLQSSSQTEIPIYVVITMRTDYLGECAQFHGLPEIINEGQYLTPRLTRDQRKIAITGPAAVFGGEIDPQLLNQLLNDMGTDPDQLPLMQHVMRRMWITACKENPTGKIRLCYPDYQKAGCLGNALSIHAEEIMSRFSPQQSHMTEIMFRNLCEQDSGSSNRYVRRPLSLDKICAITGIEKASIETVIHSFRHQDCSFLTPLSDEPLTDNSLIDISHESLIRQWPRLKDWVDKETKSAEVYKLLLQNAVLHEKKQGALYTTPNLEIAINKKNEENWTSQWSERYGGQFQLAIQFLEQSIYSQKKKEESKKKQQEELQNTRTLAETQRKKANLNKTIALATGCSLLFLMFAIVFFYLGFVFESGTYYNTWVKKFGLPVGIGKLARHQVFARSESYKIIKKGYFGQVVRLEVRDSKDKLKESDNISSYFQRYSRQSERISTLEFTTNKHNVVSEMAYNNRGNLIWGFVYSPISPVGDIRKQVIATYIGKEGVPKAISRSTATSVRFTYSPTGYETEKKYLDSRGNPQPGLFGAYGLKCDYNKKGQCIQISSTDARGNLINDENGYCICRTEYNSMGNAVINTLLDPAGNRTLCADGYSVLKAVFDNNGNLIEESFFDGSNYPTYNRNGYHSCKLLLDKYGKVISKSYYDIAKNPVFIKGGFHENRIAYDDKGNIKQLSYFGFDNQAVFCKDNYHKAEILYDTLDRQLQWKYFDINGNPCKFGENYYHCRRLVYDDKDDLVKISYYDINSIPARAEDNWTSIIMLYDNRHNLIQNKFMDQNDKPTLCTDGYHIVQYDRDDRGNIIREQYFGSESSMMPVSCKDGYQTKISEYDERGFLKSFSFFNSKGEKTVDSIYGCYLVELQNDEKGNDTLLTYWGNDGNMIMARGVNKTRIRYDERNNWIEKSFFDTSNNPVNCYSSYHRETAQWNIQQNRIEWKYFDINGRRVNGKDGFHRKHCDYDQTGNLTSIAYFDTSEHPFIAPIGYHSVKYTYNRFGGIESCSYYGPKDAPLAPEDFHKMIKEYNTIGQIISISFLDTLQKHTFCKEGYYKIKYGYNDHGFVQWVSYHGINDENILHRAIGVLESDSVTFHKKVITFDSFGNCTGISYFDQKLQPISVPAGYSSIILAYDANGNEKSRAYFRNNGEPVRHLKKNYHKIQSVYDSAGHLLNFARFGINGEPILIDDYHKSEFEYDSLGYAKSRSWYGCSNEPVEVDGIHKQEKTYDKNGNLTSISFFDKELNPASIAGYHKYIIWYDSLNREVRSEFYGVLKQPVNSTWGYFRKITKFDNNNAGGKLEYYYDEKCRLINIKK